MSDLSRSPWRGGWVRAAGLTLRPWSLEDVPFMVAMFDTEEMNRWTPLAHPFDASVAAGYVTRAHEALRSGMLQLAVTEDGGKPLGEVLLFSTEEPATCELAYAIGAAHRGKALAARAVRAVLPVAAGAGFTRARLLIAIDNTASQRVAEAAGFARVAVPLKRRERKGFTLQMATWCREL